MAAVQLGIGNLSYGNGAVVTTSGGNIYVFFVDHANVITYSWLRVFKSIDGGASFSTLTATSGSTIHASTYYDDWCSAAIDSAGYVHVVVQTRSSGASKDVAYAKFNTADDTWSAWEEVAALSKDGNRVFTCTIAVDSSDKPHVLYTQCEANMGTSYRRVYYTNKTGASWLTPEQVNNSATEHAMPCSIVVRGSNVVEAFYIGSNQTKPCRRTRSGGSWGSETVWTNGGATLQGRAMLATTGGTVYAYHSNPNSTYGLYENDAAAGSIDITETYENAISATLYSSTRYVLYRDQSDFQLKYITNAGSGWSTPTVLVGSQVDGHVSEWAYNNENQSGRINYIYTRYVAPNYYVYFNYISLASTATDQQPGYLFCGTRISDQQGAFLQGTATATDNQPAFIPSAGETIGYAHSYLQGKSTNTDQTSAYLRGVALYSYIVDHESGTLAGEYDHISNDGGSLSVTSTSPLSGTYSLHIGDHTGEWTDHARCSIPGALDGANYLYFAFLLRINQNTGGTIYCTLSVSDTFGNDIAFWTSTTGGQKLYTQTITDQGAVGGYEILRPSLSTTYQVETITKIATTTSGSDGFFRVWVDGNLSLNLDNLDNYNCWRDYAYSGTEHVGVQGGSRYFSYDVLFDNLEISWQSDEGLGVGDFHAYLKGKNAVTDSQSAYLLCALATSDQQSAYLYGQAVVTDSQPAFLSAPIPATDGTAAYLRGCSEAVDAQAAFLTAPVVNAVHACLIAPSFVTDSLSAYLSGPAQVGRTYGPVVQMP